MPLPTFVIAGAQKCGTTTLAGMLRQHPRVAMSRPKELHFFTRHRDRGLAWYADQFRPRPRHRAWGEATPAYLFDPPAREAMCAWLPAATRFVVILRDPVARAYSHYWHVRRTGVEDAPTFEQAVALEPERLGSDRLSTRLRHSYLARGHYVDQLLDLEQRLGRERIHVLLLEDLLGERVPVLEELFSFLGVNPGRAAQVQDVWRNRYRVRDGADAKPRPASYPPMSAATRTELQRAFEPSNRRLGEWLGRDLSAWNAR